MGILRGVIWGILRGVIRGILRGVLLGYPPRCPAGVSSEVSSGLGASMYNYYYELSQVLGLKWTHLDIYFVNIYEDVSLHIVLETKK